MPDHDKTADFTAHLGHDFARPQLLRDALTHPSLAGSSRRKASSGAPYERLEFLGDRVLGLVIAEWLYQKFPDAREGDLAKRHASLVNRDILRGIALEIGLEKHLRLARGENATGSSRTNLAALSDAMEAVIGALYLDGGIKAASAFIHTRWKTAVEADDAPEDPKTALQEWAQGAGLALPSYRVVERHGPPHAPKFLIEVSVVKHGSASAEGPSKRAAEKAAAAALLAALAEAKTKSDTTDS